MTEFELIQTHFKTIGEDVELGIGDDAAVVNVPIGRQLVVSSDTLISGVHFESHDQPEDIAHKAVAVNLSDMAAMAAEPRWISLVLSLPKADTNWLSRFSQELSRQCDRHRLALIGGDTSRGQLSVTLHIQGLVETGQYVRRSAASPNEDIYVTGCLGDAAAGLILKHHRENTHHDYLISRLLRPEARVKLGLFLQPFASAMLDISDGLVQDLGHISQASQVSMEIHSHLLPLSTALQASFSRERCLQLALSGGEDYELGFCSPKAFRSEIDSIAKGFDIPISRIGQTGPGSTLSVNDEYGQPMLITEKGYQHFS